MDKKITIQKSYIIIFALIVFFEPQMFKQTEFAILSMIDNVYKLLKILLFVVIFMIYTNDVFIKNKKISKLLIMMYIFQIIGGISTIINHGSLTRFIGPSITTVTMIMLCELLIERDELFKVLKIINKYFRFLFILNIVFIIVVDFFNVFHGANVFLLGIDNRWIFMYLPWITFEFLVTTYDKSGFKVPIFIWLICEVTLLYRWSVSAMIFNALWVLILLKHDGVTKRPISIFILTMIVNFEIVVVKIQDNFAQLIYKYFYKSSTFSGRTFFWDKVLLTTQQHPFLGGGMQSLEWDQRYFLTSSPLNYSFMAVGHAHNGYVNVIYRSGYLGLALYIYMLFISVKSLFINKKNIFQKPLCISFIIFLLLSLFDTFDGAGIYFIMTLIVGLASLNTGENHESIN